ncbi:MAG: hypothetical protein J6B29_00780 [Clostridia bacterium]|nr:hypothetical protein [Clostridia bacterium]
MVRKTYTIEAERGICLDSPGDRCDGGGYIKNMLPRNGALCKRNGRETLCTVRDSSGKRLSVNGIFSYGGNFIIHAGKHLFISPLNFSSVEELSLPSGVSLLDRRSKGYENGGILWIYGAGEALAYDGERVLPAYEHERAYVPVTAKGITDTRAGSLTEKGEEPSLLTRRRKNTLRVVKELRAGHTFTLDSSIDPSCPIDITVKFRVKLSGDEDDEVTTVYVGADEEGNEINTVVYARYHADNLSQKILTVQRPLLNAEGKEIKIKEAENQVSSFDSMGWPIVIHNLNEINILYNPTTPVRGEDNVTVEFTALEHNPREVAGSFTDSAMVTGDNGQAMLVLSNGSNCLYHTHTDGNLFYISCKPVTVGLDSEPIVAMSHMADNYIGIYKRNSFFRLKLMADTSCHQLFSAYDRVGSISPFTVAYLDGDGLTLDENGVFGILEPSHAYTNNMVLKERARAILPYLRKHTDAERENAVMCSHQGRVYIFIGDNAYVADKSYKFGSSDSFEYEWWMLDNCRLSCASSLYGELYMGNSRGEISHFGKGYSDIRVVEMKSEDYEYLLRDSPYTYISFANNLGVKDGDKICLSPHHIFHSRAKYSLSRGALIFDEGDFVDEKSGEIQFFEGMELLVCNENGVRMGYVRVHSVEEESYSLICTGIYPDGDKEVLVYLCRDGDYRYTLREMGDVFFIYDGGENIRFLDLEEIEWVRLVYETPVEAIFESCPLRLGSDKKKSLQRISVVPTHTSVGEVAVGYRTQRHKGEKLAVIAQPLSLDSPDFSHLAFSQPMRSISLPFLATGFEYIRARLESRTDKDFGFYSIKLTYKETSSKI